MSQDQGFHYIAGAWLGDAPNGMCDVTNPSDGSVLGQAPHGSAALAGQAVDAARHAFETTDWPQDPRLRADVLLQFADLLQAASEQIATLMAPGKRQGSGPGKTRGRRRHQRGALLRRCHPQRVRPHL